MRPARSVRLDVSGLKHRQCTLTCDRTSPFINIGHNHSECALAKSRSNEHWFAITGTLNRCYSRWAWVKVCSGCCRQSRDGFPESLADRSILGIVPFSLDNIETEIRRHRNPFFFSEKEWFGQKYATDRGVLSRLYSHASILRNSVTHFRKRSYSVAFTE